MFWGFWDGGKACNACNGAFKLKPDIDNIATICVRKEWGAAADLNPRRPHSASIQDPDACAAAKPSAQPP